jgi:uncharacterized membrane protein
LLVVIEISQQQNEDCSDVTMSCDVFSCNRYPKQTNKKQKQKIKTKNLDLIDVVKSMHIVLV